MFGGKALIMLVSQHSIFVPRPIPTIEAQLRLTAIGLGSDDPLTFRAGVAIDVRVLVPHACLLLTALVTSALARAVAPAQPVVSLNGLLVPVSHLSPSEVFGLTPVTPYMTF